ncbi:ParB/RepB/Spo0J family partition protein [Catenovulum maritimum]|uniref:Probable chromosome-partitioning protein ParB n=1 Tax=Catenovulum maritimum TaxID=1513271 RepID=A0A0J8JMZ7_9ALTE|nr:ParB/RepB/Spo0J family partition protein [Catenovulum maritimum]KMT65986.1 chromosome partitioning protein ParB [Catenovulum maritimum]
MSVKKRGLGRGLDALLTTSGALQNNNSNQNTTEESAAESHVEASELQKLPIEFLQPGKYQPRKDMSPEALEDLANSIKAQGIIQPIVVRPVAGENQYEIIAGERRWRAAQIAELAEVPCLIKDIPDEAAVAVALIENIQREDLNAMEEAIALDRLLTEFDLTHQQVAQAVGKSRTTVTNLLRLNTLQDEVKTLLEHGDIDMGHARALLGLEGEQQSDAGRIVAAKGLTVRDTEKLVSKLLKPAAEKAEKTIDPDVENLQNELANILGSSVKISHNRSGKGKMVIDFANLDALEGILEKLR